MKILSSKEFEEEVLKGGKKVLVDFFATWCGPCKMLAPVLEDLDKEEDLVIGKVDVDVEEELASQFQISSIPSLFVIKDGKIVRKSLGYQSLDQLKELVK